MARTLIRNKVAFPGTLAYYDGTAWRRVGDDTTLAA